MRNTQDSQEIVVTLDGILGRVCKKGVSLWQKNGQLHYKAPKGALTPEEIDGLKRHSRQIVTLLEGAAGGAVFATEALSRDQSEGAPLAFSQLAHWNHYQLHERPGIRQVAGAFRLRGRLNVVALQRAVAEVVKQHNALRTRVIRSDGICVQKVAKSFNWQLEMGDVTGVNEALREIRVRALIRQFIMEPIDISSEPLFGIKLLKCGPFEHVLIVAMEHMISDMASLNIFLQDVFASYIQTLQGLAASLPEIPIQFPEYATWQRNSHESWLAVHGAYWQGRLERYARMRAPLEDEASSAADTGWGTVPVWIGPELKAELREWCRMRQTTLVMSVFTAYAALILRWYDSSEGVILFQTDGRDDAKLGRTMGFLSTALYLHVELLEGDTFVDLMHRIRQEYCQVHQHADHSYFASRAPRPGFTRNTLFNWIPAGAAIDLSPLDASRDILECSSVPFDHPMLDELESDLEPMILLYDSKEGVTGNLLFPRKRFSAGKIEQLGRSFLAFVETLLRQPDERVTQIPLAQ